MRKLIISVVFIMLGALLSKAPNISIQQFEIKRTFVENIIKKEEIQKEISNIKQSNFTPKLLRRYLELKEVKHIDVIIAQFRLETGHFKSKSFLKGNNISGMKKPRIRANLASGELYGHAAYDSWGDSIEDFLLFLNYYKKRGYDLGDYYGFLKKIGYATNPEYIKILKLIRVNA